MTDDTLGFDPINPSHYVCSESNIECIEAIEAALTCDEFRGYLKGNCMKYLWRERHKNGLQDVKKLNWYADRLVVFMDYFERDKV